MPPRRPTKKKIAVQTSDDEAEKADQELSTPTKAAKSPSTPTKGKKSPKPIVNMEDQDFTGLINNDTVSSPTLKTTQEKFKAIQEKHDAEEAAQLQEQFDQLRAEKISLEQRQANPNDTTSWTFAGNPLPKAPYAINLGSSAPEITAYFLAQLFDVKFKDVRRIVAIGMKTMVSI